jgi:hypothetical protein
MWNPGPRLDARSRSVEILEGRTDESGCQEALMSQFPSAGDHDDPDKRDLDGELEALIEAYQEVHRDDDRLRRIERRTYIRRPAGDAEPMSQVVDVGSEEIAPALKSQDARRVSAGILRTAEDVEAYAARFAQASSADDPTGKNLERQAHAVDATGTHWLLMVGQNRDHGLVACRFVREKGIPHARIVSFNAERLRLPILVVELEPERGPQTPDA